MLMRVMRVDLVGLIFPPLPLQARIDGIVKARVVLSDGKPTGKPSIEGQFAGGLDVLRPPANTRATGPQWNFNFSSGQRSRGEPVPENATAPLPTSTI